MNGFVLLEQSGLDFQLKSNYKSHTNPLSIKLFS
jgi:hypothetical protein